MGMIGIYRRLAYISRMTKASREWIPARMIARSLPMAEDGAEFMQCAGLSVDKETKDV
jgi:hypothetical protein